MTKTGKPKLKTLFGTIKKINTVIYLILFVTVIAIIFSLGVLLLMSPGQIRQFTSKNGKEIKGSMAEKCFIKINGVTMGMIIKSKDISNPVLLFVHGGPGMPEYFLTEKYPPGLEDYFTVVYWEQRGVGLSYSKKIDNSTISVAQYIEDTIAVTNYLQKRFNQDKIYLMAHSWGTYFSIQAVQQSPQLYHAYIAVAQVTNQDESEKLAYQYLLDYYTNANDQKTLKKLKKNPYPSPGYAKIRDDVMHRSGIGTTHNMKSVLSGIFLPSLKNLDYTFTEKINLWRGKRLLNKNVQLQMNDDLQKKVTVLEIPTYFFSGIYDYTVNYKMSQEYLTLLKAPVKGFYLFEHSAHSPIFEEPSKVAQIIKIDILSNTNTLANIQ